MANMSDAERRQKLIRRLRYSHDSSDDEDTTVAVGGWERQFVAKARKGEKIVRRGSLDKKDRLDELRSSLFSDSSEGEETPVAADDSDRGIVAKPQKEEKIVRRGSLDKKDLLNELRSSTFSSDSEGEDTPVAADGEKIVRRGPLDKMDVLDEIRSLRLSDHSEGADNPVAAHDSEQKIVDKPRMEEKESNPNRSESTAAQEEEQDLIDLNAEAPTPLDCKKIRSVRPRRSTDSRPSFTIVLPGNRFRRAKNNRIIVYTN